jgi:hypothetical protein
LSFFTWDQAIEKQNALIVLKKKELLKKALMQQLLPVRTIERGRR